MRTFSVVRIVVLEFLVCFSLTVSAQNAVPNPDFDSGANGWSGGSLLVTDGSPSTPSYLVASPSHSDFYAFSDCFALSYAKQYVFTAEMRIISGNVGAIQASMYQDSVCTTPAGASPNMGVSGTGLDNGVWTTFSSVFILPPINVMSGKIALHVNSAFNNSADVLFDHIVLEPEEVFSGDFESP